MAATSPAETEPLIKTEPLALTAPLTAADPEIQTFRLALMAAALPEPVRRTSQLAVNTP
jgi:hypothetical protein